MDVLEGKTAIVAGGTSGIGERIAELFVAEGAEVVVAFPKRAKRWPLGSVRERATSMPTSRTRLRSRRWWTTR
jgi:NAD(P)-dependent dehydrogenase (short-subunit alcohol dehydrogenase family)